MVPLYIPSRNIVIRRYTDVYVHPDTKEVYGGTDYDNSQKCLEIGAFPLRKESPPVGMKASSWEIVTDPILPGRFLESPVDCVEIPPDPILSERRMYENKYLEATKALMKLAGETVGDDEWPKLEDVEFENIGMTASLANPGVAGFLLATLNYTLSTLKYDYQWSWNQIEHRD